MWKLIGLSLIATALACAIMAAVLGRKVLTPVAALNDALTAASQDIDAVDKHTLPESGRDEISELIGSSNRFLEQVAASHRDSLYFLKALSARSAAANLGYDVAGNLVYANTACVRLSGYTRFSEMAAAG